MANILVVSTTSVIGGAEIVLKSWIENSKQNNYYILTTTDKSVSDFYKDITCENIKKLFFMNECSAVEKSFKNLPKFFINNIKIANMIKKVINKHDIDIVYGNNSLDCFPTLLCKLLYTPKIPVINHIHDMLSPKSSAGIMLKLLWKKTNYIFVPSNATRDHLINLGIGEKVVKVVYNSVDIQENSNISIEQLKSKYDIEPKKKVILFAGRFDKNKNVELFIDIVNDVSKYDNNILALFTGIIGDEQYFDLIKQKLKIVNFKYKILLNIEHEDMYQIYRISDILILTSHTESLPTVVLEAMANNLLVLARNVNGVREIISHDYNGLVFEYDEKVSNISNIILKMLDSDSKVKRVTLINNGKKTINNKFTHHSKVNRVEEYINKLVN